MAQPPRITPAPPVNWTILAGGRASRLGGQDKGLVMLAGRPLIQHVLSRLQPQLAPGSRISINANRNLEQYRQWGEVFSDQATDFPGPLGGMQAALRRQPNSGSSWFGFVPCDCPALPRDLVARLTAAIGPETEIVVAHDGKGYQPVVTLLHRRILPKLEQQLTAGRFKIILLYDQCQVAVVDYSDQPDAFINLNTPDDLAQFASRSGA